MRGPSLLQYPGSRSVRITGRPIDKSIHAEHDGTEVYFCCAACVDKFKTQLQKRLARVRESQN